jgi:hypothetical protein
MHKVLDTGLVLEPGTCCVLGTSPQSCLKPYFLFLLLIGMNTKATTERQKDRKKGSEALCSAAARGVQLAHLCLLHTGRLIPWTL